MEDGDGGEGSSDVDAAGGMAPWVSLALQAEDARARGDNAAAEMLTEAAKLILVAHSTG